MEEKNKRSPIEDWEEYYKETPTEELPWFSEGTDAEVIGALKDFCPAQGRLLELGAGPGTMAAEFARMGYEVTACDISETALKTARERAGELSASMTFLPCDIREGAPDGQFDIINDRGCFHCMRDGDKSKYLNSIISATRPGSVLLLKTFSYKEPGNEGPCRYSVDDIIDIFADSFELIHSEETIFKSTLETNPKAILCVLRRV